MQIARKTVDLGLEWSIKVQFVKAGRVVRAVLPTGNFEKRL